MKKRRDGKYPSRHSVHLSVSLDESLRKASEIYGVALGTLLRCAIERGWPAERAARHRARQQELRQQDDDTMPEAE
ncbi:MAG: hypothetical protein OXH85_05965 [Truepera sp.]|nr:hypothetical protein [Truepera sp.]